MLTIAQKIELLDMLKEGRSYASIGRHYGINESSVRYIKKEEKNIRTMAAVCFNEKAKRVVTFRNKTIVRVESALVDQWLQEREHHAGYQHHPLITVWERFIKSVERDYQALKYI